MLKEISDLTQTSDDLHRRWFADENLNLYVWQDADHEIAGFQIGYRFNDEELVLTWRNKTGLSNHKVDSGSEDPARVKASPILVEESEANIEYVHNIFEESGQKLEDELYEFI
ncbi:MAG: hypothetical protein HKN08_01680, partial [Gammaproteobacteria bacterium]|nr:hypothetical protein [Gammaproteobacteria bacterium]